MGSPVCCQVTVVWGRGERGKGTFLGFVVGEWGY
jgi:hypothetical protein